MNSGKQEDGSELRLATYITGMDTFRVGPSEAPLITPGWKGRWTLGWLRGWELFPGTVKCDYML